MAVAIAVSLAIIVVASVLTSGLVLASSSFADGFRQAVKQVQQQGGATAGGFGTIKVCQAGQLNQQTGACQTDLSGSGFQTDQFACSVTLSTQDTTTPTLTISYSGHEVITGNPLVKPNQDGSYTLYGGYALTGQALPGGRWTCRFAQSSNSKSLNFRVDGPTGSLLYQSACPSTSLDSTTSLCGQDQNTLSSPSSISCTALVIGSTQKSVQLDFAYQGGAVPAFHRTVNPQPDKEFFPAYITLQPQDVALPTSTMPAGSYVCRWSIDGQKMGEKDFQVG